MEFLCCSSGYAVHPVDVLLVEVLDGLPLDLEGGGDHAAVRVPHLLAQRHGACSGNIEYSVQIQYKPR